MKKIFRKAMTVAGSAAMIGMTMGTALAASYPTPFTSDTAIVVGSSAASSDTAAMNSIAADLDALMDDSVTTLEGAEGITENEVPLGGVLNFSTSKIVTTLTDSKIDGLLDSKINWDDGGASGADDYDFHEEIRVGSMTVKTTFDDNEFEESVALDNNRQLEYRYVFDDAFNVTGVGATDADDLYLTILGQTYEISAMTNTSITVVTSQEVTLAPGESVTVDGKVFTLDDLSSTAARVNGETVTTSAKKVDGLKVQVKSGSIFYNENFPEQASVTLNIGEEISETYTNGEAYIGEPTTGYQWKWNIDSLAEANGYIGVAYARSETNENDDIAYVGGSYMFPENFGEVSLDGLTSVDYEDFKVYFESNLDIYNSTEGVNEEKYSDQYALVVEAIDGRKDAFVTTTGSHETSKLYIRWAANTTETQGTQGNASLELLYEDVNQEIDNNIVPRFSNAYATTAATGNTITTDPDLANLVVGDTTVDITADVTGGDLTLIFTDTGAGQSFTLDIAGSVALSNGAGRLEWFGASTTSTTSEDNAETTDILVGTTAFGTKDNDIMTYQGIIIEDPEDNLNSDVVMFSVPSDRVYAQVSVLVGGQASVSGEAGVMTVTDADASELAGKNLIVVGGSAINSVAADLLNGAHSEAAFTEATDVAAGEFLIQSFERTDGSTALLVAGYDAADTSKGVEYLLNYDVDTTVGTKLKGTSATEATVVESA